MVSSALSSAEYLHRRAGRRLPDPAGQPVRQGWLPPCSCSRWPRMTLISGVSLFGLRGAAAPIEILTGGAPPPYAINLRMGLAEGIFAFGINLVALLGAGAICPREHTRAHAALPIYGHGHPGHGDDPRPVQSVRVPRDRLDRHLGLLGLQDTPAALSAAFKYLMATVLASTFFLLGTVLLYAATGTLNIDDLIAHARPSPGRSASPR